MLAYDSVRSFTSLPRAAEVVSILAALTLLAGPACVTDDGPTDTATTGGDASSAPDGTDGQTSSDDAGCGSTHRKVGWTAELEEEAHNVGGTAKIVDNCTIAIENFTYDGGGIRVRAYVAPTDSDASFASSGVSISGELVGDSYDGKRVEFELPDGLALSDVGALSIWCVDVNANFGSGSFSP